MLEFQSKFTVRAFMFLVIALCVLSVTVMPVAADSHGGGGDNSSDIAKGEGIICGGNEQVETVFRALVSIFMLFGFVFGMVIWAAGKVEESFLGSEMKLLGGVSEGGNDALRKAFVLPFIVYFFDLIDTVLFGVEITCIVPKP